MDADLILFLGIIIGGLSVPSIVSSISDGRAPRVSMVTILVGGGLILFAMTTKPGGYSFDQLPDVFLGVISRFMP